MANEVSAGTSLATETSPSTSWVADRIAGIWDVDAKLQLRFDLGITRSYPPAGTDEPTNSTTTSLSVSYSPNDHWSLSFVGGWTPASTSYAETSIVTEETGDEMLEASALLGATSTTASAAVSVGYDTAGESDRETSGSLSFGVNHVQSQQTFSSIIGPDGEMLTTEYIRDYCGDNRCSPEIEAALSPLWTQLTQFSIDANVTRTEYQHVDLALDASYYLYDKDPTTAGYFRLAGTGPSHLGNGVSVSPLRFAVSPSIASRWGKWSGTLGVAYGESVADRGYDLSTSLKVQYKLRISDSTRMKLYSRVGSSWGVDQYNDLTTSLSMALGAQYKW